MLTHAKSESAGSNKTPQLAGGEPARSHLFGQFTSDQIKAAVAERYGQVATAPRANFNFPVGRQFAEGVGYDPMVLDQLPCGIHNVEWLQAAAGAISLPRSLFDSIAYGSMC
jgi:hypothetical protein